VHPEVQAGLPYSTSAEVLSIDVAESFMLRYIGPSQYTGNGAVRISRRTFAVGFASGTPLSLFDPALAHPAAVVRASTSSVATTKCRRCSTRMARRFRGRLTLFGSSMRVSTD